MHFRYHGLLFSTPSPRYKCNNSHLPASFNSVQPVSPGPPAVVTLRGVYARLIKAVAFNKTGRIKNSVTREPSCLGEVFSGMEIYAPIT